MKICVSMKTPDALEYAAEEAYPIEKYDEETDEFVSIDPDSEEAMDIEDARQDFKTLCEKWFRYGEEITLEIDTESETCKILPNK